MKRIALAITALTVAAAAGFAATQRTTAAPTVADQCPADFLAETQDGRFYETDAHQIRIYATGKDGQVNELGVLVLDKNEFDQLNALIPAGELATDSHYEAALITDMGVIEQYWACIEESRTALID